MWPSWAVGSRGLQGSAYHAFAGCAGSGARRRALDDSIIIVFKQPRSFSRRNCARGIVIGVPRTGMRGDGAPSGAPFLLVACLAARGALRRSITAISDSGSALPRLGRALFTPVIRRLSPPSPCPVQRAPRRAVLVPPGRGPGASRCTACEAMQRAPFPIRTTGRTGRAPRVDQDANNVRAFARRGKRIFSQAENDANART
jgi:hypothetical protein